MAGLGWKGVELLRVSDPQTSGIARLSAGPVDVAVLGSVRR